MQPDEGRVAEFSLFLHRSPSGRVDTGHLASNPLPSAVHSAFCTLHFALPLPLCILHFALCTSLPRRGIMIRALTVKDILDEQIAKKLA